MCKPNINSGSSTDLYPLPSLPVREIGRVRTRRSQQRITRHRRAVAGANETIWALNNLFGVSENIESKPSAARDSAVNFVLQAHLADRPPMDVETPEAAYAALLGTKASSYGDDSLPGMAPFCLDLLSLPGAAGGCSLLDTLEGGTWRT